MPATQQPWQRLVESMTRDASIRVSARMKVSAVPVALPEGVLDALVGAGREALRNVARHAGVDRAEVAVRVTTREIEIDVGDQGRGLPRGGRPGYGIRESIISRMTQVGGSAEIGPGRYGAGTLVRIRWPAAAETHDERIGRSYAQTVASSGGASIVRTVAVPMLVAQTVVALSVMFTTSHSWATPVVAASLVAGTLVSARQLERGAPTLLSLTGWGLTMAVVAATGLWAAGPGALADLESFAVGFASLPLIFFGYVAPLRYAPILIVPLSAVVALATELDPRVGVMGALGCFTASALGPGTAVATGMLMRRSAARTEEQRNRVVDAHRESQRLEYLERARRQYLHHTEERILPWLEAVATGGVDCTSPATRERARLLGLEARDDLHTPGFFDGELRGLVTEYRREGGEVVVRPGVAPGASRRVSGHVLRRLVQALPPSYRLTISAQPGTDHLRLVVVPALPASVAAQVGELHPRMESTGDEFATVLRFPDLPLTGDGPRDVPAGMTFW